MIKYYTADYVLPVATDPLKNGIVAIDDSGKIVGLYDSDSAEIRDKPVEKLDGIITPGFVNSHCHLELSYLAGKVPQNSGLIPFISNVISQRQVEESIRLEAMLEADKAMRENGIVAVGDISNTAFSVQVKKDSAIYYHTYVELLCFEPEKVKQVFKDGAELRAKFESLPTSIVPHSPYSVCKELFRHISAICREEQVPFCMHNQESEEENKFYRYKTGQFLDFYKGMNLNIEFFKPQARDSIQSIIPLLPESQPVMLVHNTYTSLKDIYFIRRFGREITWCFCPNANLYIENTLPKVEMFLFNDFDITIGTDSLASNNELDILSELKTLHDSFPSLSLEKTIAWATLNGASFLKINDRFGSIEKGKTPGLNLISNVSGLKLSANSKVRKLA